MTSIPPGTDHARRMVCRTSAAGGDSILAPLDHTVLIDAEALGELPPRQIGDFG